MCEPSAQKGPWRWQGSAPGWRGKGQQGQCLKLQPSELLQSLGTHRLPGATLVWTAVGKSISKSSTSICTICLWTVRCLHPLFSTNPFPCTHLADSTAPVTTSRTLSKSSTPRSIWVWESERLTTKNLSHRMASGSRFSAFSKPDLAKLPTDHHK